MEIKKIEKSDLVLFFDERSDKVDYPRLQERGVEPKHIEREAKLLSYILAFSLR